MPTAVSVIVFFAPTFRYVTVLEEAGFALRAEGFEYRIDRKKRLFAGFDRTAEIPPHLDVLVHGGPRSPRMMLPHSAAVRST